MSFMCLCAFVYVVLDWLCSGYTGLTNTALLELKPNQDVKDWDSWVLDKRYEFWSSNSIVHILRMPLAEEFVPFHRDTLHWCAIMLRY